MEDDDAARPTAAKVGGRETTLARRMLNNLAHATDHHATLAMFVWQHR